jgi:hypothetical protein
MNKLEEHIANSPLVRAAIVEAVHRFYYDRVLSDKKEDIKDLEDTNAAAVLSKLWNLYPDWRHTLYEVPKRYKSAEVSSVNRHIAPPEIVTFVSPTVAFI